MRLILIMVLTAFSFSCENKQGKPALSVVDSPRDLGSLRFDSSYNISFTLVNTGSAMLYIDTVSVSCECTEPSLGTKTIEPNDSAELAVKFTPYAKGSFSKVIVVKSNIDSVFTVINFNGQIN